MTIIRISLPESPEGRVATSEKDSLLRNVYREKDPDGVDHAVKRAGLVLFESASGTFGNGVHRNWSVVDNTLLLATYFYAWGASPAWYGEGVTDTRPLGSRATNHGDGYISILAGNITAPAFGITKEGGPLS